VLPDNAMKMLSPFKIRGPENAGAASRRRKATSGAKSPKKPARNSGGHSSKSGTDQRRPGLAIVEEEAGIDPATSEPG